MHWSVLIKGWPGIVSVGSVTKLSGRFSMTPAGLENVGAFCGSLVHGDWYGRQFWLILCEWLIAGIPVHGGRHFGELFRMCRRFRVELIVSVNVAVWRFRC